jgi:hypothetical protein
MLTSSSDVSASSDKVVVDMLGLDGGTGPDCEERRRMVVVGGRLGESWDLSLPEPPESDDFWAAPPDLHRLRAATRSLLQPSHSLALLARQPSE